MSSSGDRGGGLDARRHAVSGGMRGAGLGLRREMLPELDRQAPPEAGFYEVAPENWMEQGGRDARWFAAFAREHPVSCHGLSLSLGSPAPLDTGFVDRVARFLDAHGIVYYSEHLSACSDDGHLYDLMPIPFTMAAAEHVAARIRTVQRVLGRRIAIENVSYYTPLGAEMSEAEFVCAVLDLADCELLLDVNNVYVNAINQGYDARAFIDAMPAERIGCLHVAGHYVEAEDLRIDTHGDDVCEPVWDLLAYTYRRIGVRPTLLERDFNIPPLQRLRAELARIAALQRQAERADA